ncbi:Alpha/Beta hydrolase protein [Exophiala viscosa]|uniref:Alpha/Beta hydrolase protein n=1 Tax=Exophiala viscosa TaxID=2486360 RepID=A0AAN6DWF1_9EURO|nr:Alpha/Beta hydrolase protein [Exophiala viscosa]
MATSTSNVSWADCQITTETFKQVGPHPIKVDIVFPPGLKEGKHPLIIAYHGGYLIAGARNFYFMMASWLPSYAASTNAILISPDHRLLPSASVAEILSDLEDLWLWVHSSLPSIIASHTPLSKHSIDLNHILLEGNSAGGFHAAHLALTHHAQIRAAILVYPMVDCLMDHFTIGPPESQLSEDEDRTLWKGDVLDRKIEQARTAGCVTTRVDAEGRLLTRSMAKRGKLGTFFKSDPRTNPLTRVLDPLETDGLPTKVVSGRWILQGKDDTGVPPEGSIAFEKAVLQNSWSTELILDVIHDEPSEHGFDRTWTMADEKLTKRLDWINQAWL